MSNTPHTLGEEFPGKLDTIHALKAQDVASLVSSKNMTM
ncbi:protein of unknown function [Aminobacter niigataensis]|nr:protein of unknown function [Aminobacter niigataensis]